MSGFFQVDEKVTLNRANLDFLVHQREFFVVYCVVFGVSFCFFLCFGVGVSFWFLLLVVFFPHFI